GELPAAKVQIEIDESDSDFVEQKLTWLKLDNQEIVLIAPGSIWATKRWLPEHFAVLCGMLKNRGFIPVLTGSKSDSSLCAEIAGISGAANLCGQTTIPQTIYLMQKSRLLVTNDSAPTHFAYLAGCPALVIYGPTSPKFGFGPRGEKDKMIQLEGLKCSPCRIHGSDKCPIKTFDCMKKLLPERVFKMCMEMIG
ncbi:MAG: glycosyltransferase family 9 protein, partial [Bacteroidota bacterium]